VEAATQAGGKTVVAAAPAGQKLYAANCSACHPNGGNIVNRSLPLKTSNKLADLATFTAFIRSPKMPDGSKGVMPSFPADQVTDKQAGELFTYISSARGSWK
jgi:mono/diheme cytochrome c family protein